MANQITINIGAAANDGTGDPLRTAFNDVNLNFSNVWNTGLPTSNIQFLNNRILTTNTNANLILAPNGVGKVASNVDIVPNTANVFALGGLSRRWNTIYGQYLDLSHNAVIGGNLTVTGNLSAGNISYTSNVFVGDLEGSVFDGASSIVLDVIDSAIYVDNYRYANGTPVVFGGNYSNSNVSAFLAAFGSNSIVTTGNISVGNASVTNVVAAQNITATTGTFTGDQFSDGAMYVGTSAGTVLGSDVVIQITANSGSYSQTNFQNINSGVTASSDYILTADNGNDTTRFLDMGITSSGWDGSETNVLSGLVANNGYLYVQDGNLSLGVRNGNTSYKWNFDTTGNLTVAGNIIPTANNTQSLGSATRQWNDLYLSNATIYMNSVPISLAAGNVLTVNGEDVVTTNANGQANIGNLDITGTYVSIAPGASETIITISPNIEGQAYLQIPDDATANAYDVRMHNDAGNIELGTGSGSYNWYFDNTGNLTIPNGGYINFVNTGGITQAVNEDLRFTVSDDEQDGWAIQSTVNDGAGADLTRMQVRYDGVQINTDVPTNNYNWTFRDSGEFDVPKSIRGPVGGNLVVSIGDQFGSDTFIDLQTRSYVGDALISNIRIANPNVTVSTASGAYNWTFGGTGNLTLPLSGNIVGATANNNGYLNWFGNSSGDGGGYTTLRLVPDDTRESADQYLIIDPTAPGHIHIRAGGTQDNSNADLFLGGENSYFKVNAGANNEVRIAANSHAWVFGADSILTVPGEGVIRSIQDTVILQSYDISGNTYSARLGTTGGLYFETTAYPLGWLNLTNNSGDANISSPGGSINIDAANGTSGAAGKDINITAGDADQSAYYTTAGGDVNIQGGMGASNDGGGGGPGGDINLVAGTSADPAGHAGNITITSGSWNWQFINNGNLYVPGQINGDNNGALIIDGAGYGNGYISLPAGSFGGEQVAIVNDFSLGNGIALTTNGGTWHFGNSGALTAPGAITTTGTVSGQILVASQSAANEGGEIQLALPSSGTALTGNIVIDSYQNLIRFFESSGNNRGLYVDVPNVSVTGQYALGYRDVPQIALSGNVTANSITAGKHFYSTTAGNLQITIPDNANVAFPTGATITVVVNAAGNVIVAQGTGVSLYMAGSSTTGNRTVGAYGLASVMKVATDTWVISGTGVY